MKLGPWGMPPKDIADKIIDEAAETGIGRMSVWLSSGYRYGRISHSTAEYNTKRAYLERKLVEYLERKLEGSNGNP